MRVLVVEDEPRMAALVERVLREEGATVDVTASGEDAVWMAASTPYEAVVLDVMLPDLDGFAVCRRLREQDVWTPVLMLTARDAIADRVTGLDVGADDYLLKPFAVDELLARLRALVRRGAQVRPAILQVGDLRLDPAAGRAWCREDELSLAPKEFAMLEAFMRRPGELLTRDALLGLVWDHAYENRSNVVDVYVRYLREKVDRPYGRASLQTVRGRGYRLEPE